MRIISGKYGGQQLVGFSAGHIRPTTDRVKESLFNILRNEIEDAKVLDLFSGTGSLGLEAISRGASECVFVEGSSKSISIIKKNLAKLKVTEPVRIVQKDVLKYLTSTEDGPFDLIFADPPFTESIAHDVMQAAARSRVFASQTVLAIESGRRERIDEVYPGDFQELIRYDQREFGDKFLSLFRLNRSDDGPTS